MEESEKKRSSFIPNDDKNKELTKNGEIGDFSTGENYSNQIYNNNSNDDLTVDSEIQLYLEECKIYRPTIFLATLSKIEYDALLDFFDDLYQYNQELQVAMMHFFSTSLTEKERIEYISLVTKNRNGQ